jgi:hypothetical protein
MPCLGVFCFLWDDPLFNPEAESARGYLLDPEFINLRRQERLLALELLYIKIAALERSVKKWKETAGRHVWTVTQLVDRANISHEILEAVNIEQQVNMMDSDFSFADWLNTYTTEQDHLRQSRSE